LLVSGFHEHLPNPVLYFLLVTSIPVHRVRRNGCESRIVMDVELPSVTSQIFKNLEKELSRQAIWLR
jgi:hypothetical protein